MQELEEAVTLFKKDKKIDLEVIRELQTGKEAMVYLVSQNDELRALKVYRDFKTRAFQTQKNYLQDRYVGDGANIKRAIAKGNEVGRQFIQDTWIMREVFFVKKIQESGGRVPKLISSVKNGILLEYLGTSDTPAPRLSDYKIPEARYDDVADDLLWHIDLMLSLGIVHGDLSPFNILWWQEQPYIIDFPQAVDIRESKRVPELLARDIKNTLNYFGGIDESTVQEITNEMLERHSIPLF